VNETVRSELLQSFGEANLIKALNATWCDEMGVPPSDGLRLARAAFGRVLGMDTPTVSGPGYQVNSSTCVASVTLWIHQWLLDYARQSSCG
jgi:hypothetical protein